MRKLIIATKNSGKFREIADMLSDLNLELVSLNEFEDISEIEEDGTTYSENALIKARIVFERTNLPVLSDDSGLEVVSLNFQPGVRSARFAGEPVNYLANNKKLLSLLKDVPESERKARFICVVVFKNKLKEEITEGICAGRIASEPRGEGGFGYDPLFIPEGYQLTFAEINQSIKNKISHRAKAIEKIKPTIIDYFSKT